MNCNCPKCGNYVDPLRIEAGYTLCLKCGEREAIRARSRWCVAPLHKSNYVLVTDASLLRGINIKTK